MKHLVKLFILSTLLVSCQEIKEPTIFLIPHGFRGEVTVIYDSKNGKSKEFENQKKSY